MQSVRSVRPMHPVRTVRTMRSMRSTQRQGCDGPGREEIVHAKSGTGKVWSLLWSVTYEPGSPTEITCRIADMTKRGLSCLDQSRISCEAYRSESEPSIRLKSRTKLVRIFRVASSGPGWYLSYRRDCSIVTADLCGSQAYTTLCFQASNLAGANARLHY